MSYAIPQKIIFSAHQVRSRHHFLERFIGTKEVENTSYESANQLLETVLPCTLVFTLMETVCYFVFSEKVRSREACNLKC